MKREDIIRMAREVGLPHWYQTEGVVNEALLIKFAALVASAERDRLTDFVIQAAEKAVDVAIALEREACAELCESIDMESFGVLPIRAVMIANHCAEAIRARGQA